MKRILVTGAGGSASYNFIESLRHNPDGEEYYIVGTDISKYHLELSDVNERYLVPRIDEPQYLEVLNKIIDKERIDFVQPQPDVEVEFLSKNQEKVHAKMMLPAYSTIELCQNKMVFRDHLMKKGVSVPDALYITSRDDLYSKLPVLLEKHEKVWLRAIRGAGAKAALPVKEIKHAEMWIDYWITMKGLQYDDFMVSEFLPGKEFAFQSLWNGGELICSQARERLEYVFGNLTPSGQSSSPSVAVTVHNDEVNEVAYKAISSIDEKATGVFCADLKTDKDGKVKILEVNAGRFFTTSYFFSSAGANMPHYYAKLALGEITEVPLPKFNAVPKDLYWVRMIDMGYKLVKESDWSCKKI